MSGDIGAGATKAAVALAASVAAAKDRPPGIFSTRFISFVFFH